MLFVLLAGLAFAGDTLTVSLNTTKTPSVIFGAKKLAPIGPVTINGHRLELRCGAPGGTKTCGLWDTAGQEEVEIARTTNILLDDNGHVCFTNDRPAVFGAAPQVIVDLVLPR